jgi:hypothetical protein
MSAFDCLIIDLTKQRNSFIVYLEDRSRIVRKALAQARERLMFNRAEEQARQERLIIRLESRIMLIEELRSEFIKRFGEQR